MKLSHFYNINKHYLNQIRVAGSSKIEKVFEGHGTSDFYKFVNSPFILNLAFEFLSYPHYDKQTQQPSCSWEARYVDRRGPLTSTCQSLMSAGEALEGS